MKQGNIFSLEINKLIEKCQNMRVNFEYDCSMHQFDEIYKHLHFNNKDDLVRIMQTDFLNHRIINYKNKKHFDANFQNWVAFIDDIIL